MGAGKSSEEEKQERGGLFSWQKLPVPENETIHYDPRYEHIAFKGNNLFVSDYHNRIFEWEGKVNDNKEPIGYQLKVFRKYEYENKSGTQAGKRFDKTATSLAWIGKRVESNASTLIHYYDIKTQIVHNYDVEQWLTNKYGEGNSAKITQPKAIINLGNGQVLFMVVHYKGNNKSNPDNQRATDVIQVMLLLYSSQNTHIIGNIYILDGCYK